MYKDPNGSEAAPPHPGEILRDDVLPCLELSPHELARHLGITDKELHALLSEEKPVTPDLASRLGAAFGQGARYWIALQAQHDGWTAECATPVDVRPLQCTPRRRTRSPSVRSHFPRAA